MVESFTFDLLDFRYLRNNEGLNVIFPSDASYERYKLEQLTVMLAENKFSVEVMGRLLAIMCRISYEQGACTERRTTMDYLSKALDESQYY